jgi:DNA-nicking Smr family endonuclease
MSSSDSTGPPRDRTGPPHDRGSNTAQAGAREPQDSGRTRVRGSLADLADLRNDLTARARRRELEDARRRAEQLRLQQERDVFRTAVTDAVPLQSSGRVDPAPQPVPPVARQFLRDESLALAESISDQIDIDRLLDTDDALSHAQPGIGQDVVRKLRRGHWVIQDQIDLHGLRVDEAREALVLFLVQCLKREIRCVRIIHGKGLGSPSREPVLKGKVLRWLIQRDEVLAFCQAGPSDGGSGAVLALLKPPPPANRSRRR